ncbi:MAG: pentapeptide repeat-containing protein [Acidimicrobiales bacterium]
MAKRTGRPQHPRLPGDLAPAGDIDAADDVELIGLTVQGDCSERRFAALHIEESHILHASFVGADLRGARLVDVLMEGADFSGADLEEASLSRVEFVDCRLSAAQVARTTMEDVTFTECKLDDANFRMSQADRILFDHVNLRGAEFSAARLSSAFFFDCDATGAEFSQVVMPGARFHGSSLADIEGGQSMRDIIIDSAQVLPLALRVFMDLGIRIEDDRDRAED